MRLNQMPERIKKVNEVLTRELSKTILKEIDLPRNILVTVTEVETSRDLDHCRAFISVFPTGETEKVLRILNKESYNLHQILNKKLFIKRVPKIQFFEEKKLRTAQRTDELLDNLKNQQN